jgi:hypothetical protein
MVIDPCGDRQARYPNIVLVHVSDTVRMQVYKTLVPNDVKGLTNQVVDLRSDILIGVFEYGDRRSWIDSRRWWYWADSRENTQAVSSTSDTV